MTETGSYNVQKFSTSSEGEIRRLNAQLDLFWEKEFALYGKIGLKDGMAILDCGSGPGYLTEKLLSALPNSTVTAVERDPSLVKVAEQRLFTYRNDHRCSVVENSILQLDFPDNHFDFIITRLVVEHVPDPLAACRELYRVVKPGGIVVVVDNDFEMHVRTHPAIPELGDLYSAYCKARSDEGGNPKIGRELPVLLKNAGCFRVDLEIISAHSAVIGDGPFLKSEGPGIPTQLVESGYLAAETYQTIISKWHQMLKDPDHAIVRQLYVASGSKPDGQSKIQPAVPEQKNQTSSPPHVSPTPSKGGKEDALMDLVKSHVINLLPAGETDAVSDDMALTDIGIDSELALELQEALTSSLALTKPLPATLVFDYPTIRAIARFLQTKLTESANSDTTDSVVNKEAADPGSTDISRLSDSEIEKRLLDKLDSLDQDTL